MFETIKPVFHLFAFADYDQASADRGGMDDYMCPFSSVAEAKDFVDRKCGNYNEFQIVEVTGDNRLKVVARGTRENRPPAERSVIWTDESPTDSK